MEHVLCKSSSPELSFETFQLGGTMKKLTDVTRQDLFDIIRDGFVLTADPPIFNKETNCFESSYNVRMPFGDV